MPDFANESVEAISIAEVVAKHMKVANAESVEVLNFLAKGSNGVFGDMAITNTAMSAAEFEDFFRDRSPIGFSPFKDLVPGELTYQTGYLMFVFEPETGVTAVLSAQGVVFNADVPDLLDSGNYSVLAAGSTINFNRTFAVAPNLSIVPLLATAATVTITSAPSATSFSVKVFNAAGTAIACDIHWTAVGY